MNVDSKGMRLLLSVSCVCLLAAVGKVAADDDVFRGTRGGELVISPATEFPELPGRLRELAGELERERVLLPGWMPGDFRRPLATGAGVVPTGSGIGSRSSAEPTTAPADVPVFDEFVPAPLPNAVSDAESEAIRAALTARYSSPPLVRAVRAMSLNAALNLHAEVSERIDRRSLEPTSYETRVRRALRNLLLALDNEAFRSAMGLRNGGFELDIFRQRLSDLASRLRVGGFGDSRAVLDEVLAAAAAVRELPAGVVAWEFAVGSVDTLDRFSGLSPADPGVSRSTMLSEVRSASLDEEMVGVGVEVTSDPRGLRIVRALRGSPAAAAGLRGGDLITEVDGRSLSGLSVAVASDLMAGREGQALRLKVVREGAGVARPTLVRARFHLWTVNDARLLDGSSVGYLSLSRFSASSAKELSDAMTDLYRRGMRSIILDLRGNPGGLLTTCVEISDLFLPRGTIVSTRGRLASDNQLETASFSRTWKLPLVLLVDGNSASASEILAAAVQENGRGVVVGEKSYGKGSVQTHFTLSAVPGDLRLTTALFFSPNGRRMAGEGVTPDLTVTDDDGAAGGDKVLEEARRLVETDRVFELARTAVYSRRNSADGGTASRKAADRPLPVAARVL
jgi:carboxyl-terminal processing protease